jgi:hypothetical protein
VTIRQACFVPFKYDFHQVFNSLRTLKANCQNSVFGSTCAMQASQGMSAVWFLFGNGHPCALGHPSFANITVVS